MLALLVDLDAETSASIATALAAEWRSIKVVIASGHSEALEAARRTPDLVLINACATADASLQLAAELRQLTDAPIVLLCDRERPPDRVQGLRLGVDDFLLMPLSQLDLRRRARAALRLRSGALPAAADPPFEAGTLRIDYAARSVTVADGDVRLTPIQYGILYHLTRNPDRVLTYRTLLAKVWGRAYVDEVDYLKVQVEHLRAKLRGISSPAVRIVSRRGIGYVLVREREPVSAAASITSREADKAATSS